MKNLKHLIYSLLFIYSSLNSTMIVEHFATKDSKYHYSIDECNSIIWDVGQSGVTSTSNHAEKDAECASFGGKLIFESETDFFSLDSVFIPPYFLCQLKMKKEVTFRCDLPPCDLTPPDDYSLIDSYTYLSACEADLQALLESLPADASFIGGYPSCFGCPDVQDNWIGGLYVPNMASGCTPPKVLQSGLFNGSSYQFCALPPTCNPPLILDPILNTCVDDPCDRNNPNFASLDCDSDGIPNISDDDIDGDGTDNEDDTDPYDKDKGGDSGNTDYTCKGSDLTISPTFSGISGYPKDSYRFLDLYSVDDCVYFGTAVPTTWDSSFYYPDKNPNCLNVWCSVHELTTSCSSSYLDVSSLPGWTYSPKYNTSATYCESSYDSSKHNEVPQYFLAALPASCPSVGYCFSNLIIKPPNDTNSEDDDSTMDNDLDTNSTSADLKPLLESANTRNKHLQDLKDKSDINIEKLEAINNNLDDLRTNSYTIVDGLKKGNDLQKSYNRSSLSALDTLKINSASTNSHLTSLKTKIAQTNNQLSQVNNNLDAINTNLVNGLFNDINPFADVEFSDGSDGFDGFETELSSNLGILNESNIFGLTSISSSSLPTYRVTISSGNTVTIFEPSMLDGLPIIELKALIMFMCALLGFVHTFRST